jgi:hypothetical protein
MSRMSAAMVASVSAVLAGGGGLEPLPGAQRDHRHANPAAAQAPVRHARHPLGSAPEYYPWR